MRQPVKPKHKLKEYHHSYYGRGRYKRLRVKHGHHRHRRYVKNSLKHETYDILDQGNKMIKYFCNPWDWD